jgi:hypothetical protein
MKKFSPGFRFSLIDSAVLAAGIALAVIGTKEIAIISLAAVGHFFLFCNVFRMSRIPELIWAGAFVILSYCTLSMGKPTWMLTVGSAIALAAALIFREMKKPYYHGILWRRVNPDLPEWWKRKSEN